MTVRCARFLKWGQLPAVAIASVLLGASLPGEVIAAIYNRVEINCTDHGIPHVVASNFEGVGGYGYAAATLDICGLAAAFATFSTTRSAVAEEILANSQTPDPSSPFHFDETRLYASKTWVRLPFTRTEVEAAAIAPPTILTIGADKR